jgi:YfiH family protein
MQNHQLFASALGYDEKRLVFSDQVHKTCICTVTEADCGKGIICPSDLIEVDGLVTESKNVPLITFYADCVPLFFADPIRQVVGMAHSGWRGTVARIGKVMVEKMESEFGCQKENIYAVVGPSICQDCYEVSSDVAAEFQKEFSNHEGEILRPGKPEKYQLNLWKANEIILKEAGLKSDHIEVSGICTCCNHDILFSHRYTNGKRGNLGGVIWL